MRRAAAPSLLAGLLLALSCPVPAQADEPPVAEATTPETPAAESAPEQSVEQSAPEQSAEQAAEQSAEQVLTQAEAALDGAGVGAAPDRDVTLALREVWLARPDMTPAQRRTANSLLARPTTPGADSLASYDPGATTSRACGARVCVTYVSTTADAATPAWANQTLATMESAWTREVDQLGYRAPAPDGVTGGDARFDVYLANISAKGLYGYCAPEAAVPNEPMRAQSYCVLDNDMTGFSMDPLSSLTVTAAHEFFHAVQFNIDAAEDQWFMEATATWMEEQVADDINDNRQFLKAGQLGRPGLSLDSYSSDLAMYGNWLFVQRLSQSFGVDAVRAVWDNLDATVGRRDDWSLQGLNRYLAGRGVSWSRFYTRFLIGNLAPRGAYEEGRAYRASPVSAKVQLSAGQPVQTLRPRVAHLSSQTVRIKAHRSLPARARLRVTVHAQGGRPSAPVATLLVLKRSGRTNQVDVHLNRHGQGSAKVSLQRGKVKRVLLVLGNASLRYRNCGGGSTWACGGKPRDDGRRIEVELRALR